MKVADILVLDDGLGTNNLTVSGADAASFQIIANALFLKTGTTLNATAKPSYSVTVAVDDPTVGSTPDATVSYTLNITASSGGTPQIIISEVAPWSSGNSPVGADWFEVTNIGTAAQDITGWKMDDNSNSFGSAVALNGVTASLPVSRSSSSRPPPRRP
ncbi:MAG: lamin tail domain-containing protein [Chthoniobacter sp.]